MSVAQYLPIPPELSAHACDTVSMHVSQLPFLRGGVCVTAAIVGVTMECLNAEPTRALPLTTPQETGRDGSDGLDRYLEQRLGVRERNAVTIIAEVLCNAGIAEMTEILDRQLHRPRRAVRLLPPWTWHIGSTLAPSVRLRKSGDSAGSSLSWLDLCPVCRDGNLGRVEGKQLFGIPRTDFYMECSRCGAKFIPVGPAFRLVSIARVRDPLWKKYLDTTYPPDTWAAIARGAGTGGRTAVERPAAENRKSPILPSAPVPLTLQKDGSIAVPVRQKILYFRPVPLLFATGIRRDVFSRVQKTLSELLAQEAFFHLRSPVNARYSRYLPLRAGLFLAQLKEWHDPFYREFLNPYGDEMFGTFRVKDARGTEKKGILIVVASREVYYVTDSLEPLLTTVNDRFGRVGPEDCLLTGNPVRCRINTLLCTHKKDAGLYMLPIEDADERLSILHAIDSPCAAGKDLCRPGSELNPDQRIFHIS